LPTLDVTALKKTQLESAAKLFNDFKEKSLLPIHEIENDAVRQELDERFGSEVLGLPQPILAPGGPLEVLRMKLGREPSIRGRK
jgi:hypothetical protein